MPLKELSTLMAALRNWGIEAVLRMNPIHSHWGRIWRIETAGGLEFFLKEGKTPLRAQREYELLRYLKSHCQPVAVPQVTSGGVPYARCGDRIFILYPRLQGEVVTNCHFEESKDCAAAIGGALASLHRSLRECPQSDRFTSLDLVESVMNEALPALALHPGAFDLVHLRHIASNLADRLHCLYPEIVDQLVHRDPNPSNILLDRGRVTGILDFGVVVKCPRIHDPCYFALSLLRDSWDDHVKRAAWPRLLHSLLLEYGRLLDITGGERRAVPPVLEAVQFLFIAFDLKLGNLPAAQLNAELLRWLCDHSSEFECEI